MYRLIYVDFPVPVGPHSNKGYCSSIAISNNLVYLKESTVGTNISYGYIFEG